MRLSICGTWSGLPKDIASELFARAAFHRLKAGDTLFQTGDSGDGCYRLDSGLLKVSLISPQSKERIVAILTPGTVVGDLAVIDGLPRSASVLALTDCELRFLTRAAFEDLAREHPEIHQYLVKLLAARLRQADDVIASLAFPAGESARRPGPAYARRNSWEGDRLRWSPDPPHNPSGRHRRDRWSRPRKYKSGFARVGAEEAADQIVGRLSDR